VTGPGLSRSVCQASLNKSDMLGYRWHGCSGAVELGEHSGMRHLMRLTSDIPARRARYVGYAVFARIASRTVELRISRHSGHMWGHRVEVRGHVEGKVLESGAISSGRLLSSALSGAEIIVSSELHAGVTVSASVVTHGVGRVPSCFHARTPIGS